MYNKLSIYNLYYQWWKNIDKLILSLIILLFLTGLFFSLVSTSLIASDKLDTNSYSFFFKHLIFIFLGLFLILIFSSINQNKLFNISLIIFIFSLIFLILVPIIGIEVKGSKRWIDLQLLRDKFNLSPIFGTPPINQYMLFFFLSISIEDE